MPSTPYTLGAVSYLNAKPLIQGLDCEPNVRLTLDVPSRLAGLLDRGSVDAALVPTIDLVGPGRAWRIISDACIGCDGETLTVRVFSRIPPQQVTQLHVDGDSHTSVALARVVWQEMYGTKLDVQPFHGPRGVRSVQDPVDGHDRQAVLLIGDKVVRPGLFGYEIETDLGAAWKTLTGLPFVFAAWAAPTRLDANWLAARLSRARDAGVAAAAMIAADLGPGLGWPVTLATRYLTQRLKFTLGERQKEGMARFLAFAKKYTIVAHDKELVFAA